MIYQRAPSSELQTLEGDIRPNTTRNSSSARSHRTGTLKAHIITLGALFLALGVCIAHHVFLTVLDGRDVEEFAISQTWVRDIGNALARIVQFLLKLSVGAVLTQSIWLYVRENGVTMNELDALFSLPSLTSLLSTLFRRRVLYALILAIVIAALPLMGIFAPNALSVVTANSILRVPIPALDRIPATMSSNFSQSGTGFLYRNPSSMFETLARNVLDNSTIVPWSPPPGCGQICSYDVGYWGPALKCTEIPQSSIEVYNTIDSVINATISPGLHFSNVTHYLEGGVVYNASTNFDYFGTGNESTITTISDLNTYPYGQLFSLDVVYDTGNLTLSSSSSTSLLYNAAGYSCTFHNASYIASVNFLNGSQTTTAHVVEYGAQLGPISDPGLINASDINGPNADFMSMYAALGLADAMIQYAYGTVGFQKDAGFHVIQVTLTQALGSILDVSQVTDSESDDPTSLSSLHLISSFYDNLGQLLEAACTNLTASLMSVTGDLELYAQVPATVIPAKNAYRYQASRLWLAYGIALAAALLADVYGVFCTLRNGGAMQRTFSSIAASVRNRDLDTLLNNPGESLPARAETVKLRYRVTGYVPGEKAGFRTVAGAVDEDDMEIPETAVLTYEGQSA